MGPKKGKKAEEAEETPDQLEWKQLKTEADRLHKATKKEEHDFNEFQQAREKLNYFWIVEKKRVEDLRAKLRNKERELQDLEEKNQVEIKLYKQRLKHLLHENQYDIAQKKIEAEVALKMAQDDDRESEMDVKKDRRVLNLALRELELSHEEYIRGLKREQDQRITTLRHEFERKANEIQKSFDARIKKTRDELDKRRKEEIKTIEEKKLSMVDHLVAEHAKAFTDIKNYYNDITHNNLDLIKSQKDELKELEAEERTDMMRLHEKQNENKKLAAPLKRMQDDMQRLRVELEDYRKEKAEMRRVKAALVVVEGSQTSLKWEHETLMQRFAELKKERDELRNSLRASIFEVKQKSVFRNLLLEKKLSAMQHIQEEREAQLNEVLTRANLEPSILGQVKGNVDDVLQRKNAEARRLQSEVARLQALQEQLQTAVVDKMGEYGLAPTELGFTPVSPTEAAKLHKSVTLQQQRLT
jgi:chromosome segregation ATPase